MMARVFCLSQAVGNSSHGCKTQVLLDVSPAVSVGWAIDTNESMRTYL